MNYNFKNRVVMVTAGSRGIGYAISEAFHHAGAKVATCARTIDSASTSNRMFKMAGDIKNPDFLENFYEATINHFDSTIDILVNNNGGPPPGSPLSFNDDDWLDAINGNLLSTIRMSRLVIPKMQAKKWGRIINLTSTTAKEPAPGLILSNVTRAAVAAFAKTLAQEVGQHGITVNTVLTGGVVTKRFDSLIEDQVKKTGEEYEKIMEKINETIPVRYVSSPEEFANYILFIASEEASFLTGVAIPIDGGATKSIF